MGGFVGIGVFAAAAAVVVGVAGDGVGVHEGRVVGAVGIGGGGGGEVFVVGVEVVQWIRCWEDRWCGPGYGDWNLGCGRRPGRSNRDAGFLCEGFREIRGIVFQG